MEQGNKQNEKGYLGTLGYISRIGNQHTADSSSLPYFIFASIDCLHRGPKCAMAQMTTELARAANPSIVNIQPLPMAWMIGAATTPPTQEKMLRMKLLTATPDEDRFGMNSVSIVVATLKMIIDPRPKKKFAII